MRCSFPRESVGAIERTGAGAGPAQGRCEWGPSQSMRASSGRRGKVRNAAAVGSSSMKPVVASRSSASAKSKRDALFEPSVDVADVCELVDLQVVSGEPLGPKSSASVIRCTVRPTRVFEVSGLPSSGRRCHGSGEGHQRCGRLATPYRKQSRAEAGISVGQFTETATSQVVSAARSALPEAFGEQDKMGTPRAPASRSKSASLAS